MADAVDTAVREASSLVAQAIVKLGQLGGGAPENVREALSCLGMAFSELGSEDPAETNSPPGM